LPAIGVFAQTISREDVRILALANSRHLAKYNLAIRGTELKVIISRQWQIKKHGKIPANRRGVTLPWLLPGSKPLQV
jgi:hypothetical protein